MAEFWGDGAGGAQALTAVYVAGSTIEVHTENHLYCQATLSTGADATTGTDLQLELSFDAGQNWRVYDNIGLIALEGGTELHNFHFRVPTRCQARLSLRRRGGTADSTAYVEAYLREHDGDLDETRPMGVNYAEAISDGAGAGLLLTGAMQYGDWIDVGLGDRIELLITKTTANNPTNVYFEIQQQEGAIGHPLDAIDSITTGDVVHSAMRIDVTDIDATNPLYRMYRVDVEPGSLIRVGGMFVGGTAPTILGFVRVVRR